MATLSSFGAIGDGLTDDTVAITTAIQSGEPLDWEGRVYRHTGIAVAPNKVFWEGKGAKLVKAGPYTKEAVKIGCTDSIFIDGLEFDNNNTACQGLFVEGDGGDVTITRSVVRKVKRASAEFTGGDAILIRGGKNRVTVDNVSIYDCTMAAGAGLFASQGIFGITVMGHNNKFVRHIGIKNVLIDGVFSEDPLYQEDQDAIRIFQNMGGPGSTCQIDGVMGRRITNRLVKLHSAPNAIVTNWQFEKLSWTLPQSGKITSAVVEAQQAPATVTNGRVWFNGIYNQEIVRADTDRGSMRYGGSHVDNVSLLAYNTSDITFVRNIFTSSSTSPELNNSWLLATVSNLSSRGDAIKTFAHCGISGDGRNYFTATNLVGRVNGSCVSVGGPASGHLRAKVTGAINTGSAVPIGSGFFDNRTIEYSLSENFT